MNNRLCAIAAVLIILATPAAAQDETEAQPEEVLVQCHSIEFNEGRLNCYDRVSGYEAPEREAQLWTLVETTDDITGANRSRVWLEVNDFRGGASPEVLVMQCDGEGSSDLYIFTSGYLGSIRGRVEVTYRWNDNEPISERWDISTDGKAAFLPSGYRDFLSGLEAGGRLAFQWENYNGSRSSGVFENVQLDENARYVLEGCG